MTFTPASKVKAKLRLCLIGPAGTGKTKSALRIMDHLMAEGEKYAVIDTEHASAAKYSKSHTFDHASLTDHNPKAYADMIKEAEKAGYAGLIIDSLSHAWMGTGGALEMVEAASAQMRTGNSYSAWGKVTPVLRSLIETILGSNMHIIVTLRSKMEYVQEKDDRGKTVIRKVGMQPVMRDGIEYEFDLVGDLNQEHQLIITKTRCEALDNKIIDKPGPEVAGTLMAWLNDGDAAPEPTPEPQKEPKQKKATLSKEEQEQRRADFAKVRQDLANEAKDFGKEFASDEEAIKWLNDQAKVVCAHMGVNAGEIATCMEENTYLRVKDAFISYVAAEYRAHAEAKANA